MPNIMYRRGRAKEYRIMKKLKEEGFSITLRSAGSHSLIDVVGIDPKLRIIRLVQCKSSESERRKAEQGLASIQGTYNVQVICI